MDAIIKKNVVYVSGTNIDIDKTLTIGGKVGDSKAIGDAITIRCNDGGYLEVKVNGIWEQTEIKAFTPKTYLYNNGEQYIDLTGGYEALAVTDASNRVGYEVAPVLSMESNNMHITWNGNISYSNGAVFNKKPVDITDANKMFVTVSASGTKTSSLQNCFLISSKNASLLDQLALIIIRNASTEESVSNTFEIDVSSISGVVYYGIYFAYGGSSNITNDVIVSSIWLE